MHLSRGNFATTNSRATMHCLSRATLSLSRATMHPLCKRKRAHRQEQKHIIGHSSYVPLFLPSKLKGKSQGVQLGTDNAPSTTRASATSMYPPLVTKLLMGANILRTTPYLSMLKHEEAQIIHKGKKTLKAKRPKGVHNIKSNNTFSTIRIFDSRIPNANLRREEESNII